MKRILTPVFLTLFALLIVSCDDEPLDEALQDANGDAGSGEVTPGGNFTATIDGNSFVADGAIAITLYNGEIVQTSISGSNISGNSISLQISDEGVGSYTLSDPIDSDNPGDGFAMYAQLSTESFPYVTNINSTGTLEITEWDTQNLMVSGTFSFEAEREVENEDGSVTVETVNITDGEFSNVPLQMQGGEDPTDPETPDANFEVELDGDLYTGDIQAVNNEDGLQIATENGNNLFALQVFNPEVGSFDLGSEDEAVVYYTTDSEDENAPLYISTSGSITITSINFSNNTVSGTFTGTLQDSFTDQEIVMTNGVFENITFQSIAGSDSASALINGEDFEANTFAEGSIVGSDQVSLNFVSDLDNRIVLNIPLDPEVGTYSISENPPYSASYTADVDTDAEVTYDAQVGSGEIVITSFENDTVMGTFSFTGLADDDSGDTVTVTQGEFTYEF
ncbi:DUF6252 family protein [Mesonia aestuariivivens]|uniref:Uncharacterized protein n=1 Tax=Mesonia aestuariivivens TaxID=2796128 RepID=A0ABS6W1B2_9FLAO|nr:DUF6252 family protein [Mesonia aestuariivivens]MBW2961322.1 hypothetical protein [Mesonia aestuariivivens]